MIHMYKTPEYEAYEERLARIATDLKVLLDDITVNQYGTKTLQGEVTIPGLKLDVVGINQEPMFLDVIGLARVLNQMKNIAKDSPLLKA